MWHRRLARADPFMICTGEAPVPRRKPMPRRLLLAVSSLCLPLLAVACQKDVTEVRRDLGPVAPGSGYANTRSRRVAPTAQPQQPTVSDMSLRTGGRD